MSLVYPLYVNRMLRACHSYVTCMCLYFIFMYSHAIRMSLMCTLISSICHSCVLLYHLYVTRLNSYVMVCHPYVTRMSIVFHSHLLVCHPYVTRMYSCVIRMSLVCTRICNGMSSVCHSYVICVLLTFTCMSSVCHSYELVCHLCVTRMWFYYNANVKCLEYVSRSLLLVPKKK